VSAQNLPDGLRCLEYCGDAHCIGGFGRFAGNDYTAHMKVTKVEGDNVEFYIKTEPSKG
jgi:hypothetical protein